jgi:acyl dehydratase
MKVRVGTILPARSFGPVSLTDIVVYQGASGDFNPIHHDAEFARSAGFSGVFSVGMLSAGYLASYCSDIFGPENIRAFSVRFREKVWPGDTLVCRGSVTAINELPEHCLGTHSVVLKLTAERGKGELALSGTAVFEQAHPA